MLKLEYRMCGKCRHFRNRGWDIDICHKKLMSIIAEMRVTYRVTDGTCWEASKELQMKTYTIDDIKRLYPCYDLTCYVPEDWQGTVLDILHLDNVPPHDRLWVVIQLGVNDEVLLAFTKWCTLLVAIPFPDIADVAEWNIWEESMRLYFWETGSAAKAEAWATLKSAHAVIQAQANKGSEESAGYACAISQVRCLAQLIEEGTCWEASKE